MASGGAGRAGLAPRPAPCVAAAATSAVPPWPRRPPQLAARLHGAESVTEWGQSGCKAMSFCRQRCAAPRTHASYSSSMSRQQALTKQGAVRAVLCRAGRHAESGTVSACMHSLYAAHTALVLPALLASPAGLSSASALCPSPVTMHGGTGHRPCGVARQWAEVGRGKGPVSLSGASTSASPESSIL